MQCSDMNPDREEELKKCEETVSQLKAELTDLRSSGEAATLNADSAYRFLIDNTRDILWTISLDGRWRFVSRNVERIIHVPVREVLKKTIWDFLPPEYHDMVREKLRRRISGEEIPPYEVEVITGEGKLLPFEIVTSSIKDRAGNIIGVQGISRDIVERKRAEEALRRSYEEMESRVQERTADLVKAGNTLETILDTAPIGIIMADAETKEIVYYSKGLLRIFGGPITGNVKGPEPGSYELLLPDGSKFPEDQLPLVCSIDHGDTVANVEMLVRRYDGKEITILVNSKPIRNGSGNITGAIATIMNITRRKQTEATLRKYQLLSMYARDIILFVDESGHLIEANDAAVRAYGYSRDELLSMSTADLNSKEGKAPVCTVLEGAGGMYETVHKRKDGSSFPVEVSSQGTMIDSAKIYLCIIRDISERKEYENDLRNAKSQVELYLDLMGHDINNMNQVAIGYLEMGMDALDLSETTSEYLTKPLEMLKNSSRLIDNVMKLHRTRNGNLKLEKINLVELLKQVKREYATVTGMEVEINIKCNISGQRAYIYANNLLKDVISNLAGNAIKHSGDRKQLNIDMIVSEAFEHGRDYYRIDIEDNGPGILDDLKQKLFQRSQRGITRTAGRGLGLYIARMLIEDFRGRIWVEDRVAGDYKKGARFVVMLPMENRS